MGERVPGQLFFVVERDVHLRALLVDFLAPLQCVVQFFDDGYSALDAVRRTPPDVVVTDVLIPRLDGLALCRLIKEDRTLRDVKVLVLSAVSADERARRSGADAFMEKPVEGSRLLRAIQDLTAEAAEEPTT